MIVSDWLSVLRVEVHHRYVAMILTVITAQIKKKKKKFQDQRSFEPLPGTDIKMLNELLFEY